MSLCPHVASLTDITLQIWLPWQQQRRQWQWRWDWECTLLGVLWTSQHVLARLSVPPLTHAAAAAVAAAAAALGVHVTCPPRARFRVAMHGKWSTRRVLARRLLARARGAGHARSCRTCSCLQREVRTPTLRQPVRATSRALAWYGLPRGPSPCTSETTLLAAFLASVVHFECVHALPT